MTNSLDPAAIQAVVGSDTVDGYETFYHLIWNRPCPDHVLEWIRGLYRHFTDDGSPAFLEAFRGSTKSTAVTVTWAAYKIGLYPDKTGMIINAADEKAEEFAVAVKKIIEDNVGWKVCFPNIVPDVERGWSTKGYFVKDTRVEYGEWVRKLSPDPTFVGYGYTSGSITGKHVTGWLIIDDIHNEVNTSSDREMRRVKSIYSGTIMYTRNPAYPPTVVVGTPWRDDDLYADIKASGSYFCIRTPALRADGSAVWPEGMSKENYQQAEKEDLTGGVEVARMLNLDLSASKNKVFKFSEYDYEKIDPTWPTWGGCDYAAVADPTKVGAEHSHFGLAYVSATPYNTAVVVGGVLEQITMAEGLAYVRNGQSMFPNWQHCEIEGDGKGEEFYQYCQMNPDLFIVMSKSGGVPKTRRLVNGLGPWLKVAKVVISDASSPFLNALRNFLRKYPNVSKHDPGWDAADSVYRALVAMPHVLTMPSTKSGLPSIHGKEKQPNPWAALGATHA